jgi:hypothetical protein
MAVTRILLTGDILRPLEANPTESESVRRIRWFEDLLGPPLSAATDLPTRRLSCEGELRLPSLYADCGLKPSLDAWAELYAGDLHPRLRDRLVELCRDAIVISIELTPSIARALRAAGIPVIDCNVDPHRFLYDIPLAWRSTLTAVRHAFEPFRVTAFEIQRRAAQIKAKARWMFDIPVPEGATLVLDQVSSDSAMIDPLRGCRVGWSDYVDRLHTLKTNGRVIWRPHPNNPQPGLMADMLGADAKTDANIYHLMSHDNLAGVAAISSGGVVEARAFGKEGVHFLDRYAGFDLEGWATPVPVVGHWVSPHFWSAVLAPLTPTNRSAPALPVEKNFLRRSVNCDWGFSWIDQLVIR